MDIKEIRAVIKAMTQSERKEILRKGKVNRGLGDEALTLRLFELLERTELDSNDLQSALYGRHNKSAFSKLLARLFDVVLDSFLVKESIEDVTVYDNRAKDIFLMKRELLITELLRFRGFEKISFVRIEKIIQKSEFYEHFDILYNAMELKRKWYFYDISKRELNEFDLRLSKVNEARIALRDSLEIYLNVVRNKPESVKSVYINYLESSIKMLNGYYLKYKSNLIRMYTFFIELQYHILRKKYHEALLCADTLVEFITNHKNIYTRLRHGNILMNIGLLHRLMFRFDSSIQYIVEARKYYFDQKISDIYYFEQIFLTYFYYGNLTKANYYIKILEKEVADAEISVALSNRFSFYCGIYHFINKDYKSCIKLLNLISNDEENIHLKLESKIITAMSFLELNKMDLVDSILERTSKFISRLNSSVDIQRQKVIVKVLQKLALSGFEFDKFDKKVETLINELDELAQVYNFNDFNLILFHEWFEYKRKGVPYNHVEVMKRLKEKNLKKGLAYA